jgi:hypothetical protein
MNKFILKLFVFFLPISIAIGYVEMKLSRIPNSYNLKRVFFERQLDSIEVLALGSSQSLYGIDPALFSKKGFNLANVSQSVFYDKELLLKYLPKMPRLKLVIIPVSYFTFYYQLADTKESWRDFYYLRFWNVKYPGLSPFDMRNYSFISLYTVQTTIDFARSGFDQNKAKNLHSNGFMTNDTAQNATKISDASGILRVKLHEAIMSKSRSIEVVRDLRQMISSLKGQGIACVLITPPVWHTYSDHCNKSYLENSAKLIKSICNDYGCEYFDYFTDPRFELKDFANNDHLNFIGAKRFSEILNSEIVVPELKGK